MSWHLNPGHPCGLIFDTNDLDGSTRRKEFLKMPGDTPLPAGLVRKLIAVQWTEPSISIASRRGAPGKPRPPRPGSSHDPDPVSSFVRRSGSRYNYYMPVGKTKDAGWQIGVSRTLEYPISKVWNLVTSPRGIAIWLGANVTLKGEKGETYETASGTVGEVRSFWPEDRIRVTWQPSNWDHDTTVQIAVRANRERTKLNLHQERLSNADERERQRTHWKAVAAELTDALGSYRER